MVLLLALAPVLLILLWIDRQDLRPEPRHVVWITLALGALAAAPVALAELGADGLFADLLGDAHWSTIPHTLFTTFFGVALPEELAKFAVLVLYARRHRAFDEPMDGLVYGAAAALGFAGVENVVYVFDGGAPTALLRGLLAVPGHAFDGMLMGALLGVGLVRPHARGRYTLLALLLPTLCHTLYDLPLLLGLTPFTTGDAPSWTTVFVGCALAPLPVIVTTLQWNLIRDIVARLHRSQLATISGETTARPLLPWVGGFLDGLSRWAETGGLRASLKAGAVLCGVSASLLGLLLLFLALAIRAWPEAIHSGMADAMTDPETPRELVRLGADGCTRAVLLALGATVAANASMMVGFLRAARRLR